MGDTLHLIDATYELFRSYYGAPPRMSPDGIEVGAVQGVSASLLALMRSGATHIACATDTVVESFRNDLFEGYKTGEGIEPELFAQFPIVEDAMRALGFVVWPMVEFEADDALAAGAHRYATDFERIVIATPDKDLAQCVRDPQVVQWDRRRDVVFDEAAVQERLGVPPASVPDYLALVGDTADGIPGLRGWGAKSASTLLRAYGSIERIPDDESTWTVKVRGAKRLAETLAGAREDAALYRKLATLRTDVPLSESADDLRWRGADRNAWAAFTERYGLGGLARRPERWRT